MSISSSGKHVTFKSKICPHIFINSSRRNHFLCWDWADLPLSNTSSLNLSGFLSPHQELLKERWQLLGPKSVLSAEVTVRCLILLEPLLWVLSERWKIRMEAYCLCFKKQMRLQTSEALDSVSHNLRKTLFGYFIASGK